MKWIMILSFKMVSLSFCLQWGKYLSPHFSCVWASASENCSYFLLFSIFSHCKHATCTRRASVHWIFDCSHNICLKNSLMPHKHLKRQNVIQLHQSSDLNSNKTITECLTDKTRHVTAAQCIYNLHHGCCVELETKFREDFPSRRKTLLYYHRRIWVIF